MSNQTFASKAFTVINVAQSRLVKQGFSADQAQAMINAAAGSNQLGARYSAACKLLKNPA